MTLLENLDPYFEEWRSKDVQFSEKLNMSHFPKDFELQVTLKNNGKPRGNQSIPKVTKNQLNEALKSQDIVKLINRKAKIALQTKDKTLKMAIETLQKDNKNLKLTMKSREEELQSLLTNKNQELSTVQTFNQRLIWTILSLIFLIFILIFIELA